MQTVDYPSCCGVRICKDFGNTLTATHLNPHTKEEIEDYIKFQAELNYQQLIATINSDQYKIVAPILKKYKFKQVAKFLYEGHNNTIYTFIRVPQKD